MNRSFTRLLVAGVAALAVAFGLPVVPAGAQDDPPPEVTALSTTATGVKVQGRGWGHGIGMGQWGSLGYAVNHGWDYTKILDHYYGGTRMGSVPNDLVRVRLEAHNDQATHVFLQQGQMRIRDRAGNVIEQRDTAIRFRRIAPDTFEIADAPSCSGPWTIREGVTIKSSEIHVDPSNPNGETAESLGVCLGGSNVRWYRGQIRAVADPHGIQRTVNALPLETYLRGVVPRESPAYWGDQGGGKGINALRAQAVAARTYSIAEGRYGYADTCDTTACHVYSGRYVRINGEDTHLEHPNTDRAIADTAGQIRVKSSGEPAYTMYSSSTGGHTAYSAHAGFPAVVDLGDSVSPLHTWSTELSRSKIESTYNRGTLERVEILARNGLGADGGRVERLRLVFSGGTVERTGNEFRRDFGLRSDWFSLEVQGGQPVAPPSGGGDDIFGECLAPAGNGDIQRLYTAFFRRLPEDDGWNHWVRAKANGQSLASIAGYFVGSDEFSSRYGRLGHGEFLDLLYRDVLQRPADTKGRSYWLGLLESGQQGRGAVTLNFSNSAEYKRESGNCP